jgi:membrane protein implicated in regulation of membrane protease activity
MEQLWLTILGVTSIILEMGFISGIGFLFIGLGALSVAGLIEFNLIKEDNLLNILLALISLSSLYFLIFWKFFKNAQMQDTKNYGEIIGKEAIVIYSDIKGHTIGKVKWSGTIMNAQLIDTNYYIKEGETVKIVKVKGNILFIKSTKE